jgi:hypothetical protein
MSLHGDYRLRAAPGFLSDRSLAKDEEGCANARAPRLPRSGYAPPPAVLGTGTESSSHDILSTVIAISAVTVIPSAGKEWRLRRGTGFAPRLQTPGAEL